MTAGRPPKWASPQELQKLVDAYFAEMETPKVMGDMIYFEPVTITGLALALDTSRETLCNYEEKDEFFDTVKRAKLRCENYAEKQLYLGKSATGAIFSLKNFGWKDTQDHNHGGQKDNPVVTLSSTDDQILQRFYAAKYKNNNEASND